MVSCAVPGCDSSKSTNPQNYTFHRFPRNLVLRQKWLKMLDRKEWVPKKYSTICSKHFEPKFLFNRNRSRTKLRAESVPTLFMPVVLKPERKVSSYFYRDIISSVPGTSTANATDLDNSREKLMKKIEILKKRLNIKQKQLKNINAQNSRLIRRFYSLKMFESLQSVQNNVSPFFM